MSIKQILEKHSVLAQVVLPMPIDLLHSTLDPATPTRPRRQRHYHRRFARVDVTKEFPFLVTRLSPFYER
jgi:hypothetical protein